MTLTHAPCGCPIGKPHLETCPGRSKTPTEIAAIIDSWGPDTPRNMASTVALTFGGYDVDYEELTHAIRHLIDLAEAK